MLVQTGAPAPDSLIVVAVARALFWAGLLETGAFAWVRDLARAERLKPTTVGRMLRLARLAPDIVEDLAHGRRLRRSTRQGSRCSGHVSPCDLAASEPV